jgi:hypothetical protein
LYTEIKKNKKKSRIRNSWQSSPHRRQGFCLEFCLWTSNQEEDGPSKSCWVDRDTANKNSEGTKTPKEKLKRRRRRRRRTPPPQLPPEERKRFPKPQKGATRKISKDICSLKHSRDEIQLWLAVQINQE